MNKIEFTIPYPSTKKGKSAWNRNYGLNAYYAGKHWSKRQQDAQYWHLLVKSELARQGIKRKYFDKPVKITMHFNSNLDLSNNASIFKLIEDSLKGYLIVDDNKQYVRELSYKIHNEPYILVEIDNA